MPVDQEGRALDAHVLAPVHRLLDPHAIGRRHGLVGIGGEADGEVVFLAKLLVACDAVGRHADHLDAGLAKVRRQPGEVLGLRRAARRVVLGIEVEDDRFTLQARQRQRLPGLRRKIEVRSLVSIREHGATLSSRWCIGHHMTMSPREEVAPFCADQITRDARAAQGCCRDDPRCPATRGPALPGGRRRSNVAARLPSAGRRRGKRCRHRSTARPNASWSRPPGACCRAAASATSPTRSSSPRGGPATSGT